MKLNFDFNVKNLGGEIIQGENGHAGKLLASVLSQMNKGNSIKLYDWALKLWNKQALEIDDTDVKVLETIIEESQMITVLAKVPMLEHIKKQQEKKK